MRLFRRGPSRPILDPESRASEILFGLIMALTFTCSMSIAEAGRDDVRAVLVGALGCNLAWGIIDAVFYLMGRIADRSNTLQSYLAVRSDLSEAEGAQAVAGALPPLVASVMSRDELLDIRRRVLALPSPQQRIVPTADDLLAALAVGLLVLLSTFPVVLPFLFVGHLGQAMRLSNGIAILMLFITGYYSGGIVPYRPILSGLLMVLLGVLLVGLTLALGG